MSPGADITLASFPGIYCLFLNAEKNNEPYQRVAFFTDNENAWLACQNVAKKIRKDEYITLQKDLEEFPLKYFSREVLKTSHRYRDDVECQKALQEVKAEFFQKYPNCREYEK